MPSTPSRPFDTLSLSQLDTASSRDSTRRRRDRRKVAMVSFLAVLLVVAAIAAFVWAMVRRSTYTLASSSLRSLLAANAAALELWLDDRSADAKRLLSRPEVLIASQTLLELEQADSLDAAGSGNAVGSLALTPSSAAAETLREAIDRFAFIEDYLGWVLLDPDGRIVASNRTGLTEQSLLLPGETLDRLIYGDATVTPPMPSPVSLAEQGPLAEAGGPVMLAVAPVGNQDGTFIGGLGLLISPFDDYASLLAGGWTGSSGEVIVVDGSGRLISPSRFENRLRRDGILTPRDATSILNVRIRDPEAEGEMLAATGGSAVSRRGSGVNVKGYRDYRGVRVIGAWQWLPDYGRGIVVKRDHSEAYRPVEIIRLAFLLLTGLLTIAAATAAVSTMLYRRVAQRMAQPDRRARRLGHYELGELLGFGGMGSVYRGRHSRLCRDVAIKVLEGDQANERAVARFEREVRQTARLRHPNTISIFDYGHTADGTFFYVMEYVDGITLQQLVDYYGSQPHHRTVDILIQICGALAEAHQEGLIHRDIKPSNILLTARAGLHDVVKVLDFGLVREIEGSFDSLTRTDSLTGTPLYIAPESIRNPSAASPRSDIYSVGAVGYTLLTGQPTFRGASAVELCLQQLNEDPIRPNERRGINVPEDLQNVIMNCLSRDPEQRPASMDELADALRNCRQCHQWTSADARQWWDEVFDEAHRGPVDTGLPTIVEGKLVGVHAQASPYDTREGTAD